jgi:hypothetical protein
MDLERYAIESYDENTYFEFFSEGINGRIKKTVEYTEIADGLFNLAFGDWNEIQERMTDTSRTNNGDRDKVLATVAATAFIFLKTYPKAALHIEGSSPARTRLYQMAINNNWHKINHQFIIRGYCNDTWEHFQKGRNYKAIMIKKKSLYI